MPRHDRSPRVATTWIPRVKVLPVEARELPDVVVEMELLAV